MLKGTKFDVYKPYLKLFYYGNDNWRLVNGVARQPGFEVDKTSNNIETIAEVERASLSRTKRTIRELALCNDFKYFATFTISSSSCDRYSLSECQERLHKMFKEYSRRLRRNNKKFHYLFITEKHKDGAYHFHGLITELLENDYYKNFNGFISSHYFDTLGFNSFSEIKSITRTSNYIMKYITKDCVKNSHNQIYFCSKGLARAEVFDLPQSAEDYNTLKHLWTFENDYIKIADFNFEKLSKNLQVFLFSKKEL